MATIQDMMEHFGWKSAQAALKYIKTHMAEINRDGKHAYQAGGKWHFDAKAVERLEELRGFGLVDVMEKVESQRNTELAVTVTNLQTRLTAAMIELDETRKETIETKDKLIAIMEENTRNAVKATALEAKLELLERENKQLKSTLVETNTEKNNLDKRFKSLQEELEKKQAQKWWKFWD